MMQTPLLQLVEHPSPAVVDAMSFQEACEEKALRAKADALSSVTSNSTALTIGAKTQSSEDKTTIEQQVKEIKKLTASLKLANDGRSVGNKSGRDELEKEHVPPTASAKIEEKGEILAIKAGSKAVKYSTSQAQKGLDDLGLSRCAVHLLCRSFDGITNADTACGTHGKCLSDGAHDEAKEFRPSLYRTDRLAKGAGKGAAKGAGGRGKGGGKGAKALGAAAIAGVAKCSDTAQPLNGSAYSASAPAVLALACAAASAAPLFEPPPLLPMLAAGTTAGDLPALFTTKEEATSGEGYI